MNFPTFHDDYFDGIRLGPDKSAQIFLRTVKGARYTLDLKGVERLTLSEVRKGNIILDLVIRSSKEVTPADVQTFYGLGADSDNNRKQLEAIREKGLQILEINPSYGAEGLVLFQSFELTEVID